MSCPIQVQRLSVANHHTRNPEEFGKPLIPSTDLFFSFLDTLANTGSVIMVILIAALRASHWIPSLERLRRPGAWIGI
jgi:hypothetical protein